MSAQFKEAFISYTRRDREIVLDIVNKLQDKGCSIWFDEWEIFPGLDWQTEMQHALNACGCCVVFIGSEEPDGWQAPEMKLALNRRNNEKDKKDEDKFTVIPVLLDTPNHERMRGYLINSFVGLGSWVNFRHSDPGFPLHQLYCGIKRKKPGKYPPDGVDTDSNGPRDPLKEVLMKIKQYRNENVLDDEAYKFLLEEIASPLKDLVRVTIHG
jgi:hypothetical protein